MSGEKICNHCGSKRELDMFYRDRRRNSGRVGFCKICAKEKNRAQYLKNREARIRWQAEYNKRYLQTEKGQIAAKKSDQNYRSKIVNSGKAATWQAVDRAIKKGLIKKLNKCTICLESGKTELHHTHGYAKECRLMVMEVCVGCHNEIHDIIGHIN